MGGGSLAAALARQRPAPADVLRVGREIAAAPAHAHAHGVVHRDVKLHDVWPASDGSAALGDVGIALHASLEQVGDEWTFVDDGLSHNGSYVDGARLQGSRRLRDGDEITVGRTAIVSRSPSDRESLRTATSHRAAPPKASEAQLRVLTALCRPYVLAVPASNRQIADGLVIGVETVKTHMRALFDAFDLGALPQHQNRAALARRALETGLVSASSGLM